MIFLFWKFNHISLQCLLMCILRQEGLTVRNKESNKCFTSIHHDVKNPIGASRSSTWRNMTPEVCLQCSINSKNYGTSRFAGYQLSSKFSSPGSGSSFWLVQVRVACSDQSEAESVISESSLKEISSVRLATDSIGCKLTAWIFSQIWLNSFPPMFLST